MIPSIPLQSSAIDCYTQGTEGDLLTCVADDLVIAAGGQGVLGLLIGGVLLLALYIAGNGHPAPPVVVTILLGSALVPVLPAGYTTTAYAIVVLGIAFGVMAAAKRHVMHGGGY